MQSLLGGMPIYMSLELSLREDRFPTAVSLPKVWIAVLSDVLFETLQDHTTSFFFQFSSQQGIHPCPYSRGCEVSLLLCTSHVLDRGWGVLRLVLFKLLSALRRREGGKLGGLETKDLVARGQI